MSRQVLNKRRLAVVAAAGVLGIGIAVPTMALAEEKAPTVADSAAQRHGHHHKEFVEALARELGLPADQVEAALKKVREQHRSDRNDPTDRRSKAAERLAERLAQAVKDGKLTQEQADAITKAFESGVLPNIGGRDHRGWHRHHGDHGDHHRHGEHGPHGEHHDHGPAGTEHTDK
ncbi:MAG TPA: hypothetical protein VFX61_02065 [Micromonosporaceae bacterium]|nr:hypothetical protein [Micromonosporaceae bacterium]